MTVAKIFSAFVSFFSILSCFSQTIQPSIHDRAAKSTTDLTLDDPSPAQTRDSISYDKISGSPFWPEMNTEAQLFIGNKLVAKAMARINLVTGQLYFLKDTSELVLDDDEINKVVFSAEKSVFVRNFPGLYLNRKPVKDYVQLLNDGDYQLIKYIKRKINAPESASKLEKKYTFIDVASYFLVANGKSESILKLTKETVFLHIPSALRDQEWLEKSNLNLKNESDVVIFLKHINSLPH